MDSKKYLDVFDSTLIISRANINGDITYVNEQFCRISQFDSSELLGRDYRMLNSGYHSKSFFEQMWTTLLSGNTWSGEIRNKSKNGSFIWLKSNIVPIKNERNEISEFMTVSYEISEQKQVEKKLIDSNQYLDLALEGAGLGVWDWWLEDDSVRFDKRWCEMIGIDYNTVEMSLDTWKQRVHPDDLEQCYADIEKYFNGETEAYENIHRMKHKNGSWVHILDRGRVSERDESGKPIRFTGTHLNITHSTKVQHEKLKEINDILSATPSCLKVVSKEGKLLEMNKQGLDLIEAEDFSSVNKASVYGLVEESHRKKFIDFNQRICNGEEDSLIFEIIGLKGTRRWMESYAGPFVLANGETAHIAITNDITQRVLAEEEFSKQKALSQHQSKLASLGELAAGVGHEINNPLTVIKSYISNIIKKIDKDEKQEIKNDLERVNIAADRIAKIVMGLRTFSRSDVNNIITFSPKEALEESINLISKIYDNEGITLAFEDKLEENYNIKGNRGKFQQIFMNLITNAKDAIKENRNAKFINITMQRSDEYLQLCISDNGKGISCEIQDKIFDPFFTTKEVNVGTGIGLSLVNNFVNEFGGKISMESKIGLGTTFTVLFPLCPMDTTANEPIVKYVPNNQINNTGKVIVAEDEEGIREYLTYLLEDAGFSVSAFENGKEAFKEYKEKPSDYRLIISDMKMPLMDGETFLKSVRNLPNTENTKFILLTGGINIDFEDPKSEINQMIDGWIMKPFAQDDFLEYIKNVLEGVKV